MEGSKAGFFRRWVAFLIDIVILDLLGALITTPLQDRFGLNWERILETLSVGEEMSTPGVTFLWIYFAVSAILWGFYFTCFIGLCGQTPGKKLLRLRVVQDDGSAPDWTTAFQRFLGYLVSGSVFFLGFLWALFDKDNQTWHDKLSHTKVIRV